MVTSGPPETMPCRLATLIVAIALSWTAPATVTAQSATLAEVLKNAAAYLSRFQEQLSGIVAEEDYFQEVLQQQTPTGHKGNLNDLLPRRRLRSDLLLLKPAGADRYVEFRDVFEVDGAPVREREDRLSRLLRQSWSSASGQVSAIINESARYNVGDIQRNVNTPLLALLFLDASAQPRFAFKRASRAREQLTPAAPSAAPADAGVFRVSTEMWTIEFEEKKRPTLVRSPSGQALPAKGRFWINPSTGAVLMSELIIAGGGVTATISVSYQSEPLMGFLVPVAMNESYIASRERVVGSATYGRFRPLAP